MQAEIITDVELEALRQSAEKMLSRYSPAVDEVWWRNFHAAVVELLTARQYIAELEAALKCENCGTVCTRPDGGHYCHPENKDRK